MFNPKLFILQNIIMTPALAVLFRYHIRNHKRHLYIHILKRRLSHIVLSIQRIHNDKFMHILSEREEIVFLVINNVLIDRIGNDDIFGEIEDNAIMS